MRVMEKRTKASWKYRDFSDNDVEILGSTQGNSVPRIFQSTASSRPAKRSAAASSTKRHRYKYRDGIDTEDGDKDFFASLSD